MKRFEIITEADARVLDIGETVALRKGGHVTPLAADTLKARRVTVVAEDRRRSLGRGSGAGRPRFGASPSAATTAASR